MRIRTNLILLVGLALLAGCSRCGKLGAAKTELLSLLPSANANVVVVPDLTIVGDRLQILQQLRVLNLLANMQNAGSAEAWLDSVMRQVGIDLRSTEALKQAGLDPARGAAAVIRSDRTWSVVAIGDEEKFDATVARIARDRLGAGERLTAKAGERTLVTFHRKGRETPELGYIVRDGYAFIAAGRAIVRLSEDASIAEEASLARDEAFKQSLARLPKERDAFVRVLDAAGMTLPWGTPQTFAVRLTNEALTITGDAARPKGAPKYLDKKTTPNLLPYLPESSFLVARFQGDPSELGEIWPRLAGPHVERAVRESGFDVKAQILDNLQPGGVVGVSMASDPTVDLSRLRSTFTSLDVRKTNPFRLFHLVALAEVKDEKKAAATLEALPPVAKDFGARVEPQEVDGRKIYVTEYSQGEGAHFALEGNRLVLAAPMQKLDQTLAQLGKAAVGKGPVASFPVLQSALDAHAFAVTLNVPQLAESIRNLPTQAWGLGGMLIRESSLRMVDALGDLRAITYSAWSVEGAVQSELTLRYEKK